VYDHVDALQRIESAVHARGEHALELTILVHQAAFAVTDHDPLGPEHGIDLLVGSGGPIRSSTPHARIGSACAVFSVEAEEKDGNAP
jgi:hypothetical protein